MQSIYTYIPETNYVPREYSVVAILLLLFMVLVLLVPVYYYYYYYVVVVVVLPCHRPFLPGYPPLEPTVIPAAQSSIFRLQYFPYFMCDVPSTAVCCS